MARALAEHSAGNRTQRGWRRKKALGSLQAKQNARCDASYSAYPLD
jgi:hypothetical protein